MGKTMLVIQAPLIDPALLNPNTENLWCPRSWRKVLTRNRDILATAIKGNLTVFDLPELEFTYAPPFGSAKDPSICWATALNSLVISATMFNGTRLEDESLWNVPDVRTSGEFQSGRPKVDTIHIPQTNYGTLGRTGTQEPKLTRMPQWFA